MEGGNVFLSGTHRFQYKLKSVSKEEEGGWIFGKILPVSNVQSLTLKCS